ncbi:iron-sulfur cluster repair di-iron protein [Cyclobacterium plantarum]|uniref:iron-sulfur cluster repair di-iron protein n=1 Tax=Cyclobacterium plantarum TaxID=2716263 RepID=UPI003F701418
METTNQETIGALVAKDYRLATVFESFGIDFCCKGNRSIEKACEKQKINSQTVWAAVNKMLESSTDGMHDFNFWPLDLLADYIEKKHHRYVEDRIPLLQQYLDKLCKVHGNAHPELFEITELFNQSAGDLTAHMKKEEFILFPYVRKMAKDQEIPASEQAKPHFGTVKNPIRMMMDEHENEGDRFEKIAALTSDFTPPGDACSTYRVTFALLDEFKTDLHQHIHLENNILFPKAIEMEEKGLASGKNIPVS